MHARACLGTGSLLLALAGCAHRGGERVDLAESLRAELAAALPDWQHQGGPPDESWCAPPVDAQACWAGTVAGRGQRGDAWRSLRTEAAAAGAEAWHAQLLSVWPDALRRLR